MLAAFSSSSAPRLGLLAGALLAAPWFILSPCGCSDEESGAGTQPAASDADADAADVQAAHDASGDQDGHSGEDGETEAGPDVIPIAEVKANDSLGVPLLLGETVTVRGVVTVPTDLFSLENNEIWVQDATGGVSVYEEIKQSIQAELGDDLLVTGVVSQYAGKTELSSPQFTVLATGLPQPAAAETTTANLCGAGEPLDGDLVVVRSVQIVGGEAWPVTDQSGNTNLVIDDGLGPCALRLDHHTELNGSPEPVGRFDATGIIKQYDGAPPFDTGYALQPRFASDITAASR